MNIVTERTKEEEFVIKKQKTKQREIFWDIVKGIGILSIVIGHVSPYIILNRFVYTFHLVIFYFVSSYFYFKGTEDNDLGNRFLKKLKKTWKKYVIYSIFIIIFHNFFLSLNFYSNMYYYNIGDCVVRIIFAMMFENFERFAGAMWFVPTLLFSCGISGVIVSYSKKITELLKENYIFKNFLIIVFSIFLGIIGVFLYNNKTGLRMNIQASFLVIPICILAYFYRYFESRMIKNLNKKVIIYISFIICIISVIFIYVTVLKNGLSIELSRFEIINGYAFYIVSVVGICFCLSLAKIVERIPQINKIFAILGENSFDIMALHFFCIKVVDIIYCKTNNITDSKIISRFVCSYPQKLFIVYVLAGTVVPIIISYGFKHLNKYISKKAIEI